MFALLHVQSPSPYHPSPRPRYLVEAPSNVCTPSYLARAAGAIAEAHPDVMQVEILEQADCEAMAMGCYLAVARASAEPPKFIHITYTPPGVHWGARKNGGRGSCRKFGCCQRGLCGQQAVDRAWCWQVIFISPGLADCLVSWRRRPAG